MSDEHNLFKTIERLATMLAHREKSAHALAEHLGEITYAGPSQFDVKPSDPAVKGATVVFRGEADSDPAYLELRFATPVDLKDFHAHFGEGRIENVTLASDVEDTIIDVERKGWPFAVQFLGRLDGATVTALTLQRSYPLA